MSALTLKLIACAAMLIDHIGYLWNITAFRAVGRISFPIFLFLIYNGYQHTRSRSRYALRLGLFALLSQIPFSLCFRGRPLDGNWNVFATLLLALLCIWAADRLKTHRVGRYFAIFPAVAVYGAMSLGLLRMDNGARAMILAIAFWLFTGETLAQRLAIGACTVFGVMNDYFVSLGLGLLRGSPAIPAPTNWQSLQLFALLALPLIFAYNGRKGRMPENKWAAKAVQWGFYSFYPAHLLVLWLIKHMI